MLILTKVCTKCGEDKNLDSFHKAKNGKLGLSAVCKTCCKEIHKQDYLLNHAKFIEQRSAYREINKEKIRDYKVNYRLSNLDKLREYENQYRLANKDKFKIYNKKYNLNNIDKIKDIHKKYRLANISEIRLKDREYYNNNKSRWIHHGRKRNLAKLNRIPSWSTPSDLLQIKAIYECSARLSNCLGIPHHVDHIIPLQGKLVSGLHTPNNLRVIPATMNLQKGNKWEPYKS